MSSGHALTLVIFLWTTCEGAHSSLAAIHLRAEEHARAVTVTPDQFFDRRQ
jgi:hypothetical protein